MTEEQKQRDLTERMAKRKGVHINLIQRERKVADANKGNLSHEESKKL